jgi:tRNA threonylcarbamoyladenosine modification (KEOPS) complex  Pcc1 subunit
MATKIAEKAETAVPKEQAAPVEETGETDRAEAVRKILLNVEKKMEAADLKATLGEYIRLVQLSQEISEEPKGEMTVRWIERTGK